MPGKLLSGRAWSSRLQAASRFRRASTGTWEQARRAMPSETQDVSAKRAEPSRQTWAEPVPGPQLRPRRTLEPIRRTCWEMSMVGRGNPTNRPLPERNRTRDDPDGADIFNRRHFGDQWKIIRRTSLAALSVGAGRVRNPLTILAEVPTHRVMSQPTGQPGQRRPVGQLGERHRTVRDIAPATRFHQARHQHPAANDDPRHLPQQVQPGGPQ